MKRNTIQVQFFPELSCASFSLCLLFLSPSWQLQLSRSKESPLYTINRFFYKYEGIFWMVSKCEELVRKVNHTLSCELTFLVSETFATNQLD